MKGSSLYLRVGLLVLAGLALAIGFILYLTSGRLGSDARVFESYFSESVTGLDVGAPVRVRGVQIGRVTEIGLAAVVYHDQVPADHADRQGLGLVMVRFAVDRQRYGEADTAQLVRQGLRVRLSSQGITGVTYLEMDFVANALGRFPEPTHFWQARYTVIPSVPSTVTQVTSAAERLVSRLSEIDLESLATNITQLVEGLRNQIVSGDLATALHEASETMTELRSVVKGADLAATVAEARATLTTLNAAAENVRQLVADPELRTLARNGSQAAAELRTAMARLPEVLRSLDSTVRAARATTTDLQGDLAPVMRDLRNTIANLRDTTEALRASPSQTLFGDPPPRR